MNSSSNLTPGSCYGAYNELTCTRENCSFFDSCRYYTTEVTREERIEYAAARKKVDYAERDVRGHRDPLIETLYRDEAYFPFDFDPQDAERTYTTSQMITIIAFILRLKRNSTLWKILSDRISGKSRSLASYAREEGITRQALHKRVGKIIANILHYKIRKIVSDSRLEKLSPQEFFLYKLKKSDSLPEEYHRIMGITPAQLQRIERSLEHKLYQFT